LLNVYYELGGRFIDTVKTYNSKESEKLIGDWMEKKRVRDQMVVVTKFGAGYRIYNRENKPLQNISSSLYQGR
jgi:aryl-alcohol dehydrogenase-like predicted oxidoreductase